MHEAVKLGINFFDCSPYYGLTRAETVLGKAFKDLPRDSFVISTKVGRYGDDKFDFSAERVTLSVEESMNRLNVDYIDIIQCHDIEFGDLDQVATETIPALLKLKESGKVRAIGITGFPLEIFPYVLEAAPPGSIDVILSYCHHTVQNDRLKLLLPAMKRRGVGVINASPLCMGLLTDRGGPDWHPADDETKAACREASRFCKENGLDLPTLALSFAHNVDPTMISSTLVGIDSIDTLKKSIDIFQGECQTKAIEQVQKILAPVANRRWRSGHFDV